VIEVDGVPRRARVVVACSGGADSLALLVLACEAGYDVVAVYVDHGLRPNTAHDIDIVANVAARFGAELRVERVDVDRGGNLEARARDVRYAALEYARVATGAVATLVAHTRDDQAETVLLNLLRGSGTAGLGGMPRARGPVRRPLLDTRRAATRELCARLGLAPVHDPMNDEMHHRRVWLRREIIPRLEQGAQRDLVEVLARQADLIADDNETLDALARDASIDRVQDVPLAVARRIVRQWLQGDGPPPSADTVERVLDVARGVRRAAEIGGGRRVERAGGRLGIVATDRDAELAAVSFALPGRARFDGVEIEAWIEHAAPVAWPDGRECAVCDADAVGEQVLIRPAIDGERFRPLGARGTKLVRDAQAEAGIPAGLRSHAPIVVGDEPIWVVGYRIDDRVRVTTATRRYLWLSATTDPADS
jgi:tRNA(Ile)-lysidine synthase